MKSRLKIFFSLFTLLIVFFPKQTKAQDNKLRLFCEPVAVPVDEKKPNYSNKPLAQNNEIYEITFSSNGDNKTVSDIKIIEKFNTGVTYQDEEWIKKLFENSFDDILFKLKPISQEFFQSKNRIIIRPSIPNIFYGKTGYLRPGTSKLDLESLNLQKTRSFNDDWIYKASCQKVGLEEPPTFADNLSKISLKVRNMLGAFDKNIQKDVFNKYSSLNDMAIKVFDEWEEYNYPNEIPFQVTKFTPLWMKAYDQSYRTLRFVQIDDKNPIFDLDEAYKKVNKAILMLDNTKLQNSYSGIYLTRADIGFKKHIMSKEKSISLLKKNIEDINKYLQKPDGNLGQAYYIKGSSLIFVNTKSSVKEACQNFFKAEELGYKMLDGVREICQKK